MPASSSTGDGDDSGVGALTAAGSTSSTSSLASLSEDDPRFDQNSMHDFKSWFTWCQACRHGGHADHMADWFRQHAECPVTDCKCHCMSLDLLPDDGFGEADGAFSAGKPHFSLMNGSSQDDPRQSHVHAHLQSNAALALSNAQYHAQMQQQQQSPQDFEQATIQQQQLQLLASQFPQGLGDLDVATLAQAIHLVQLTRAANTPVVNTPVNNGVGQTVPAGSSNLELSSMQALSLLPSHVSSPSLSASPGPIGGQPLHHAASSPYLSATAAAAGVGGRGGGGGAGPASNVSRASSETSTPTHAQQQQQQQQQQQPLRQQPQQQQQQQQQPAQSMSRVGSARNLAAQRSSQPKGNFPLTRW
jgi:hypothetical protein